MKNIATVFIALTVAALSGCAASTTKADFEECPEVEGVPACIDTFDADTMGDIKKDNGAVETDSAETEKEQHVTKVVRDKQGKRHKEITVSNDQRVTRAAPVQFPQRETTLPQRMWFSPYVDEEHDIFVDQQFIHWQERGAWQVRTNEG